MLHAIQGDRHEVSVSGITIDLPGKVVPGVGRRHRTSDSGAPPRTACGVPDVPNAAVSNVALGSEDEFARAVGLIDIELQGLRELRSGQIEGNIVLEVGGAIVAAELLPPQRVRVGSAAADEELHGFAVQRW